MRLAGVLDAGQRRSLMLALLADVVAAALAADGARAVAVVTSDDDAAATATRLGIPVVSDAGLPWNEGLAHALSHVLPAPAGVLFLSADLPAVTVADVSALIAAVPARGVAVARARDAGTNALAVAPARLITPTFGVARSCAAHVALATAAGAEAVVVDRPGLSLDLDTPEDLAVALLEGPPDRVWRRVVGGGGVRG
jgi:2-phospho-L-lactate guanylyltransferase